MRACRSRDTLSRIFCLAPRGQIVYRSRMGNELRTFADVVSLWPSITAFANDVGASPDRARKWVARESIPAEWFTSVTDAAHKRGHWQITADLLARISARRPGQQYCRLSTAAVTDRTPENGEAA